MPAMAIMDRNGVYGAPRFHMAAKKAGVRAHIGSEITCTNGRTYPLLVETREGYQNLCRLVTRMKLRAKKGEGAATLDEIAEYRPRPDLPHPPPRRAPARDLRPRIISTPNCSATTIARRRPKTRPSSNRARRLGIPLVATNGVAYAGAAAARNAGRLHLRPQSRDARRPPAACWSATPSAMSRPPAEMARLFADLPEAIANTREISGAHPVHAGRSGLRVPALSRPGRRHRDVVPAPARRRRRAPPLPAVSRARAPADRARAGADREARSWPATS